MVASWAVPAGGTVAGAAAVGWAGGLCWAWAAAGISPAAAKAIAHPINLIFTPVTSLGLEVAGPRLPKIAVSIGAGFESLKRLFSRELKAPARQPNGTFEPL